MKVMHLMSTHSFSGAENVACQIINCFKDDNNFNMIYVSEIKENEKNLNDRNIDYYKLKKFSYKNVKKAVNELKPDIIHAHDIKASILASFFAKNIKVISHVHANHENMRKKCLKTLIYNFFSKKIYKFIWVSKSALDNYVFKSNLLSRSIVLYNMIDEQDIEEKVNRVEEKFDIVYLGRITYQKNPNRLIKVIKMISNKYENLRVAIIGNGDMFENIKTLITEYKLEDNIKLFGFIDNPYGILSNSKLMLLVSRYEGTPMCALEAMCLSVPVISTPTDGMCELILDGKNGYIYNDDEDLSNIIVKLLKNKNELNRLKKSTKTIFKENNNMIKYRNTIMDIYVERN